LPLLGVELDREAAGVAHGVGRAEFAGDGGEADEQRGAPAALEQLRLCVLADVLGDLEEAMRARALGVHDALGDALAVEVLHLLDDVVVVQDGGTARPDGQRELVARSGNPGVGGRGRRLAAGGVGHRGSLGVLGDAWRLSIYGTVQILVHV
jgi:hypothetical protein